MDPANMTDTEPLLTPERFDQLVEQILRNWQASKCMSPVSEITADIVAARSVISRDMVEAGLDEIVSYDPDQDSPALMVEKILIASLASASK